MAGKPAASPDGLLELPPMDLLEKIPPLRLDRERQTAPQIFEALRELIISVVLVPGTVLSRAELAEHYGISQTPIRDALMRLGEEGLVDIYPQHATVVTRIDIAAALQAHFLRRSLELEILRTLVALPDAEHAALLALLGSHLQRQAAALDPLDDVALSAADQAFHRDQFQAAGVEPLWALVRQRSGHVDRLRRLNLPAEGKAHAIVQDHQAITAALAARDAAAAEVALRAHLSGTLSFVADIRRQYPQWVSG